MKKRRRGREEESRREGDEEKRRRGEEGRRRGGENTPADFVDFSCRRELKNQEQT